MTGELVHDPWAAHFTGQHHLLQLGFSLGRQLGIQWHHHHGLVAILSKEILTYYMMASKVIPGNQDKLMESLASESFTTLLVDLGWSMVQFKLS